MSESIQTQGKTVNDAVSEALLQLGLRRDEVEIKVLEEPKSGLLGFIGSRPAKVMVRKKPEGRRGRGRDNRSEDNKAHSLSGGRGGRGRSGGRPERNEKAKEPRQEGRGGRSRGGRRDQKPRTEKSEPRAETRGKASDGSRGEPRAAARSEARGGGGSRGEARGDSRNEARSGGSRSSRSRRRRPDGRQESRTDNQQGAAQEAQTQGRNDAASARDESPATERRDDRRTGRSRRGSRGRGRDNQRDNQTQARDEQNNGSAQVAAEMTANEGTPETPRNVETPNSKEKTTMTEDRNKPSRDRAAARPDPAPAMEETPQAEAPAPAAKAIEAPTPVAKPKPKRNGWGGGLGTRLAGKANPAVKAKPKQPKSVEVAPSRPASAAPQREYRDDSRGRSNYRDQRSAPAHDEVIVSEVPASKYANPIGEVTDENLDATLSEMTSGMLARAGFPCEVEVLDGEYRQVRIASDDESAGLLIGRHGQTVDAVEHLVERMASNAVDDRVRMNLDINEYRHRRQESLTERVADAVAQVRETGKAYHVEPMSARERRLVHLEVEPIEGVKTFTMVGSGGKYVVIALEDGPDSEDQNTD